MIFMKIDKMSMNLMVPDNLHKVHRIAFSATKVLDLLQDMGRGVRVLLPSAGSAHRRRSDPNYLVGFASALPPQHATGSQSGPWSGSDQGSSPKSTHAGNPRVAYPTIKPILMHRFYAVRFEPSKMFECHEVVSELKTSKERRTLAFSICAACRLHETASGPSQVQLSLWLTGGIVASRSGARRSFRPETSTVSPRRVAAHSLLYRAECWF